MNIMRISAYILSLGLVIMGFAEAPARTGIYPDGASQNGGKETVTIKTNIYCDHCKQCESCGPRIYDKLVDTPGVQKVKIDTEAGTITVTYLSSRLDAKAVRDVINDAGFDADDQPAPAEAVARLDMCCRKP